MFNLFKRSASAEDLAVPLWEGTRDWPAKYGANFRRDFDECFDGNAEEVLDEIVYFLAFATDYAFWRQLEKTPDVQKSVRDIFRAHVADFAKERRCPPIPAGNWMDDSLIWMPTDMTPDGGPLANLKQRFDLYGQSLSRRHDRSAGERTAYVLAALCGTMDAAFILSMSPLFLGRWKGLQNILGSFKIKE